MINHFTADLLYQSVYPWGDRVDYVELWCTERYEKLKKVSKQAKTVDFGNFSNFSTRNLAYEGFIGAGHPNIV